MADRLSNPFSGEGGGTPSKSSDDFLSFSSSTPITNQEGQDQFSGDRGFKPKRGKKNRQDNWNRFGAFENQNRNQNFRGNNFRGRGQDSPHTPRFYSNPNGGQNQNTPRFYSNPNGGQNQNTPRFYSNPSGGQNQNTPRFYSNPSSNQYQQGGGYGGNYGGYNSSPHQNYRGSNRGYPSQNHRGRGNWQNNQPRGGYTPRGRGFPPRGAGFQQRGRGGDSNRGGGFQRHHEEWEGNGYFHSSMLDDPWAEFPEGRLPNHGQSKGQVERSTSSTDETLANFTPPAFQEKKDELSDSMIPQIGDSFLDISINPAPGVLPSGSSELDASNVGSEEAKLSESMIPQVGDSLLRSDSKEEEAQDEEQN